MVLKPCLRTSASRRSRGNGSVRGAAIGAARESESVVVDRVRSTAHRVPSTSTTPRSGRRSRAFACGGAGCGAGGGGACGPPCASSARWMWIEVGAARDGAAKTNERASAPSSLAVVIGSLLTGSDFLSGPAPGVAHICKRRATRQAQLSRHLRANPPPVRGAPAWRARRVRKPATRTRGPNDPKVHVSGAAK